MESICKNWVSQNEYTSPLEGTPYYRSSGIIYALDRQDNKYAVAQIDYERFDDQNFQYVFSPKWGIIDALPSSIFQGIPGLDLSLRLERYYRVNMTPVFISERTPSKGREDLWELLESVGLDYYDRFEWLLRTNMRCGTDNLIVERTNKEQRRLVLEAYAKEFIERNMQPGDEVAVDNLWTLSTSNRGLRQILLSILRSGADLILKEEGRKLSEEECSGMLKLLVAQEIIEVKNRKEKREEGIGRARLEGKYTGRKRLPVDEELLRVTAEEFSKKKVTEEEAMRRLNIKSRSTFYRRLKEVKEQ